MFLRSSNTIYSVTTQFKKDFMKVFVFTSVNLHHSLQIQKIFDSLEKAKEFGVAEYGLCTSEWTEYVSKTAPKSEWFYNGSIDHHRTSYIDFCIVEMEVE